jgi:hypothetical protein
MGMVVKGNDLEIRFILGLRQHIREQDTLTRVLQSRLFSVGH